MLKTYKLSGKVVFLSDLHLNHDRDFIWGVRGFNNVTEHFEYVRDEWFKNIDWDTTVINLGDSHFGDPKGETFERFSQWPCKDHYYLWGNHTSGAKQFFEKHCMGREKYPTKANSITFVGRDFSVYINGIRFELSHFPKRVWDGMNRGAYHLSGHSHGNDQGRNLGNEFGRCMDVGVDNALKETGNFFFTFEKIVELLGKKENLILDHHG